MAIEINQIEETETRRESKLKEMPLFMGLSKKDLEDVTKHTHYNRKHYKKGATIISEGKSCTSLIVVTSGWVRAITQNDNNAYRMEEIMQANIILEPEKLFGIKTTYHSSAFIRRHVYYPAGKKILYIKMTQLAKELGYSRLEISNALNALSDAERIILKRGIIEIPALQLL